MSGLALGLVCAVLCWWLAFKQTPDLDAVLNRTQYRTAIMFFYLRTLTWLLEMLGWV